MIPKCNTPPHPTNKILSALAHGPYGFVLGSTHDPKTRLTVQGERAHIRLSPKFSPADVGYYNPLYLRSPTTPSVPSDNQ